MSAAAGPAAHNDAHAGDAGPQANGVVFADAQRALALFAQGIAGRPLHLAARAPGAPDPARRRLPGDAQTVALPAVADAHASRAHNRGTYRAALLHQIGYAEFGTYAFRLDALARRMTLPAAPAPRRHAARAGAPPRPELERFFSLAARPAVLRRLFVIVEDGRIDARLRRAYPGACADFDRAAALALARRPPLMTLSPTAAALEALVQATLGADTNALAGERADLGLAPLLDTARAAWRVSADVYDSARAALTLHAALRLRVPRAGGALHAVAPATGPAPSPVSSQAPGGAPDEWIDGELEAALEDLFGQSVEFRGEFDPALELRAASGARAGVPIDEAGTTTAAAPDETGDPDAPATGAQRPGLARRAAREAGASALYDEWDCHAQTYRRAWCRVREERVKAVPPAFVAEMRRRDGLLARALRQTFMRLRPDHWVRVHRATDGEEPDLDRAIEARIDRRSGHAGDDLLYMRRERGRREVAAAFLADLSASTDFPVPDPAAPTAAAPSGTAPPGPATPVAAPDPYLWGRFGGPPDPTPVAPKRRVIDVERDALALLCEALQPLGDAHAVYGFSGSGRDDVEFVIAKDFDEAPGARLMGRLAAFAPRRSTRMGAAIRHAAALLARRHERVKTLIVVSDGYPQDIDYGPDPADEGYGLADTARALAEAARLGIATFCITVDPAGHDYLKRMCEPGRYMVIDDVNDLPAELARAYRTLTT